jgi:hypothetical protein
MVLSQKNLFIYIFKSPKITGPDFSKKQYLKKKCLPEIRWNAAVIIASCSGTSV